MADVSTVSVLLQVKDQMSSALQSAEGNVNRFGSAIQKHRQGIRNAGLAIGGAIAGFATVAIKNASDLNESMNAVNVVFGEGSKVIEDFGKTSASSVGLSQAKFNQLATSTGALLARTGKPLSEIGEMTTDLATRAADLASVYNTEVDVAMSAINQAIRGETEAIRQFGGEVSEASMQQFLMSQGINKSSKELTDQEKRLYRVQLIMSDTSVVAGDFARTSGDVANQMRIAKAQFADTSAKLGMALLPAMTKVMNVINKILTATAKWIQDNPKLASTIFKVTAVIGGLAIGVGILASSVFILNLALSPIGLIILAITAAVVAVIAIFVKWDDMSLKLKITLGLIMGPIVLIIAAIKNWDKIVAVLKKGFLEFAIVLNKGITGILKMVRAVADTIPPLRGMVEGLDKAILANEEMQGKMRVSADAAMEQAFSTVEAADKIQDSAKETADTVVKSNQDSIASSEDVVKALENEVVATENKAKEVISWEEFIAKETVRVADEKLKSTQDALDEEIQAYRENKKERERIAEEAAAAEKASLEKRLEFFRGNVDDRIEQMNRLMHVGTARTMFEDPWMEDMGRSEHWTAEQMRIKKESEAKEKEASDAAVARAAIADPLKSAMKVAGVDQHMLNKAKREIQFHVGASGLSRTSAASPDSEAFQEMASRLTSQQTGATRVAFEALAQGVDRFAGGGMSHGGLAMVGERGPELVNLPAGARVNRSGSGMGSNTFIFHGAVYGVEDLKRVVVEAVRDHAISGGFTGVFGDV